MIIKRVLYRTYRNIYRVKKWFLRRFTMAGVFVLICLAASAVVGVDTKRTLVYQAFTFFLSLLAVSMVSSLFFRFRFTGVRVLPRFGTAGEIVEYRITIKNNTGKVQKGLLLFENFEDPLPGFKEFINTPEPDENKRNLYDRTFGYYRWLWLISRKQNTESKGSELPAVEPGGSCDVTVKFVPPNRGVIKLTALTIARPDPLGLFNSCTTIPLPKSLLILPKRYMLPPVGLSGTRKYQTGGVALASSIGDSEEFTSLRDYRPGDPIRRFHWKSWAKTGKPVVKEYQDEFFVRHALILDTFQETGTSDIFEEAISIAASFAFSIQTQESLLDLMFVGTEAYCFTSGRGISHIDKILKILASVIPCTDKPFSSLTPVTMNRAHLLSGCICIFLSWDKEREDFINLLKGFGIPVLAMVITGNGKTKEKIKPWPMKHEPGNVLELKLGKIQEGLMKL